MRKQCLFDPNHMIDELGYTKHLLNCQSKLKKDWRKCRYSDSHWQLYKYIDFHERYECPYNPLYAQDPQKFVEQREKEIIKRMSQAKQKNSSKSQSFLSALQQNSQMNSVSQSYYQEPDQSINFGQISVIEKSQNNKSVQQKIDPSKQKSLQNLTIVDLHQVFNSNDTMICFHESSKFSQKNEEKQKMLSMIEEQQNFQSGIFKKDNNLWPEPNFQAFEKRFRQKWMAKKQGKQSKQNIGQWKKEESFSEQDQDEITIENIHSRYLNIDQD